MDGDRYDLYFGSLKVGVVTRTDSDFPNLWGTIACEPWLSSPRSREEERLVRYFALDRECNRLLEVEHEVDNFREQAAIIAEIEAEFMDVVEWRSGGWSTAAAVSCPSCAPASTMTAAWCGGGARAGGSNLAASQTRLPSPL